VHRSRVARIELGNDLPNIAELPYFPEQLSAALAGVSAAVVLGREEPVTFFGYPDQPSVALPAEADRMVLADASADLEATLELLLSALSVDPEQGEVTERSGPVPEVSGPLNAMTIGQAFASAIPADAIVVAEAVSSGAGYRSQASAAERHTLLAILGGAIGGGLPSAVGAAVAAPDRRVLCLQADGSGLYTIQSLWTMARENLDVTVVICANRIYKILEVELERAGMAAVGQAKDLVDLDRPTVEFTSLAAGFGVPSVQVDSCEALVAAIEEAGRTPGPTLIEAVMQ
jgi:acetolactate synthase-1/2/3 large subunit